MFQNLRKEIKKNLSPCAQLWSMQLQNANKVVRPKLH